ncbi:MAG TPA: lipoprotein [Sulfuricurvum sp.]|nr:lipoprotein [Sulfuricurvum sp.]
MTKLYVMLLMGMVLAISGCGYKAPPYYEKPSNEEKNSAL